MTNVTKTIQNEHKKSSTLYTIYFTINIRETL